MAGLEIAEFRDARSGSILALEPHEIPDTGVRIIRDILTDRPGILRGRGPVKIATSVATSTADFAPFGMAGVDRPDGAFSVAAILGNGTSDADGVRLVYWSTDLTAQSTFSSLQGTSVHSYPITGGAAFPYVDSKPAYGGGYIISIAESLSNHTAGDIGARKMAYWRGARKANYSTGTITNSMGATSITGSGTSWLANIDPGMFIFSGSGSSFRLLGVVKSVTNDTTIVLEGKALGSTAGVAYLATSVRGLIQRSSTGRITVSASTTTVNGGGTKFVDQGISSLYALFKAEDMTYIGDVASVASNTQLTLSAGAAVGVVNERYILMLKTLAYSISAPMMESAVHAVWNDRQFYGNCVFVGQGGLPKLNRIYFSEDNDFEAIDMSKDDGSFFDIPSSKASGTHVVGFGATNSALLIFKEDETYSLTGSSPEDYELRRLWDDGCISPMTIVPWEGGVIWAGERGVYFFDGVEVQDVTINTLGDFYLKIFEDYNPDFESGRSVAMVVKDHYILFAPRVANFPYTYITGTTTETPESFTMGINMRDPGKSVVFLSNVEPRGNLRMPRSSTRNVLYIVDGYDTLGDGFRRPALVEGEDMFLEEAATDLLGASRVALGVEMGPKPYIDSKKYDLGNPQIKKLFKQLQIHHLLDAGRMSLDVVPGLGDVGTTSGTIFGPSSTFINKRAKFLKRSQYLSFRLYSIPKAGSVAVSGSNVIITDLVMASPYIFPVGTINRVFFRIPSSAGGGIFRAALYTDLAGTPDDRIGLSADRTVPAMLGSTWVSVAMPTTISTAGTYWLAIHGNSNVSMAVQKSTIGGSFKTDTATFSVGTPDPWSGTVTTDSDEQLVAYASMLPPARIVLGPWALGFKKQSIGKV